MQPHWRSNITLFVGLRFVKMWVVFDMRSIILRSLTEDHMALLHLPALSASTHHSLVADTQSGPQKSD